MVNYTCVD